MSFWQSLLEFFHSSMDRPDNYGWFHLMWLAITFLALIPLLRFPKQQSHDHVRRVVLFTSILVIVLEVYKQITFSFSPLNNYAFTFDWRSFPFQFCSTPMYIGLLAGLTRKGKVHDCLCAYLATFSIFAGLAVMLYPNNVFIDITGVNIQTMICHGSMLTIGIYLFATGHVKLNHKTLLKALPVFATTLIIAMVLNEVVYNSGILLRDDGSMQEFSMFYISPYYPSELPIYQALHLHSATPSFWQVMRNFLIYIVGFAAAAYVILLLAMLIGRIVRCFKPKTNCNIAV